MEADLSFNRRVATELREMAERLGGREGDRFRAKAFRRAADTLTALPDDVRELRAAGGRAALLALPGVGASVAAAIEELATTGRWERLERLRPSLRAAAPEEPSVEELLEVDSWYRRRARAGELPLFAPERFNPSRAEWLPVMHTRCGPWRITAMFSNSARAHRARRTSDWVVIIFRLERGPEAQRTVVTESRGPLKRKRVVRGRESECRDHHARCAVTSKRSKSRNNAA